MVVGDFAGLRVEAGVLKMARALGEPLAFRHTVNNRHRLDKRGTLPQLALSSLKHGLDHFFGNPGLLQIHQVICVQMKTDTRGFYFSDDQFVA